MDRDFPWMWSEACAVLLRAERLNRDFFRPGRSVSSLPVWEPPVDILETEDQVLVFVALPGVDPDRVEAAIEDAHLIIQGVRVLPAELRTADIHRLELPQGLIHRDPRRHRQIQAADLLAHGLIRSSFVPPPSVQELRDLTRTRKQLVREIAQHTLRIQKTLETANVTLTSVLTDIMGISGRAILAALVAGETQPERLAALASDTVKASRAELTAALHGRVTAHHRFMLKLHLDQIASLEVAVRDVEARLGAALAPFRAAVEHLITMPGVSETVARVIVAEIGFDMTRFPSAAHLVSWAGLCPRLHESAGKRLSNRTRSSNPWLKTTLVQAAWSAARKKDSYFRAQFLRIKSRRGPKNAVLAVAASMLTAAYHMLRDGADYRDLGGDHFDRRDKARLAKRLIARLHDLGLTVDVRAA